MNATLIAEIAAAAAQLVADEGMEYGPAKRKAAKNLGRAARGHDLPSNEQVEDEVRAHLALFHAETQPSELAALRMLAARWMRRLEAFQPHLTGAVWRGTANRHSAVHLELYCDDAKSAEITLINLGIDYDASQHRGPRGDDIPVLTLADRCDGFEGPVTLHLHILDVDDLRGGLKPDARGRTWRGDAAALAALQRRADAESGSA